jgi:hypothetical protein
MKYYMKTGITETGITGVGTRDAGTREFSNLKTGTLEIGITGGFSKAQPKAIGAQKRNLLVINFYKSCPIHRSEILC